MRRSRTRRSRQRELRVGHREGGTGEGVDIKDTQGSPKEITFFRYIAARKVGTAGEERDFLREAVAIASRQSLMLPERRHLQALYEVVMRNTEYLFLIPRDGMYMLCEQWSAKDTTLEKAREYGRKIGAVLYAAKLC